MVEENQAKEDGQRQDYSSATPQFYPKLRVTPWVSSGGNRTQD
jgi:hypothetical protein